MIFGFGMPTRGPVAQPEAIKQVLSLAEGLGLGYVSVADHIDSPQKQARTFLGMNRLRLKRINKFKIWKMQQ